MFLLFMFHLVLDIGVGSGGGCSPILIDLNGDDFRFGGYQSAVFFDLLGDGNPFHLQWVMPDGDDAFLAVDLNQNGIVDHGGELFGNGTIMPLDGRRAPNGFVALAQYDDPALGGDGDGWITSNDDIWANLFLWLDSDADGDCSPGEMMPLETQLFVKLEIIPKASGRVDAHGNLFAFWAWAIRGPEAPGRKYKMVDVFFKRVDPQGKRRAQ